MKDGSVRRLALAGALAAATVLLTMFASFPLPGGHGYVNLGDAGVFVTAYMLGGGWGFLCAGLASALADILLGWSVYAPPSFLIKGAAALLASAFFARCRGRGRSFWVYPPALLIPIGYFLYETALYGIQAALLDLLPNTAQCVAGAGVAQGLIEAFSRQAAHGKLARHAQAPRARLLRDPKGGADVALIARDGALALRAGDCLSVRGYTARVLALDARGPQTLAELLPAGIPALWHDGQLSAEELAAKALEAIRATTEPPPP